MQLLERFQEFITEKKLFSKNQKLLLAVSGGLDSVVLCDLCYRSGFDFVIAHCNFRLRGEESDRDEMFVRALGKNYEREVLIKHFDTEKYAGENPWLNQLDLRILQDFVFKGRKSDHTVQLSLDFVNLGNLISSKWGVVKYATTSGYFQPVSVNYNNNSPIYQFDPSLQSTFSTSPDLPSRWQMQIGLRYIF